MTGSHTVYSLNLASLSFCVTDCNFVELYIISASLFVVVHQHYYVFTLQTDIIDIIKLDTSIL